jgi:DDE superfamily endonuclease
LDAELYDRGYELIHVPGGANSADGKMIAFGAAILYRYRKVREVFFVLVAGLHPYSKQLPNSNLSANKASTSVLAVLDREYGNATWVLAQADIQADCLMRVRKNACFWSAPPAYSGRGRPRKHGSKMRLNDPTTWLEADTAIFIDSHPQLGQVRVCQWLDLHFYRAPGHKVFLISCLISSLLSF